jgi:SpoIID/LytB domain protein
MEFDYRENRPYARVGMLQFEPEIRFTALVDFGAYDLAGNRLFDGKKDHTYSVKVARSQPARMEPMIRLAIRTDQDEAEQHVHLWEKFRLNLECLRVGENVQIGKNEYIDNREYWVLARGFSSLEEADEARRKLPNFGDFAALLIPEVPAEGVLLINGVEVEGAVRLIPTESKARTFLLHNVRVGIGFHWDHREDQYLENILEFHIDRKGLLTAVSVVDVENYVAGVNSSEMTPDCHLEFLKAQTILARCTIFATAGKHHYGDPFDVCADDHCQCYHGAGALQQKSLQAARETAGQVLLYSGRVCDTRYAKVCGGIGEAYKNVWDGRDIPYLSTFYDGPRGAQSFQTVDREDDVRAFLKSSPDVFCNPQVHQVPDYLNYAHDYFRWSVRYSPEELGEIFREKMGKDLGPIRDLIPQKRGYSGRIIYLKVVGDKGEMVIGKELEIRRALSRSHLYSSAFYVEKEQDRKGKTAALILQGGGWGHGVGLCQVGAAVMAEEGYSCERILQHYYQGAELKQIYSV